MEQLLTRDADPLSIKELIPVVCLLQHDMEDGDTLDCFIEQVGGC
jgi:hypothetical protein